MNGNEQIAASLANKLQALDLEDGERAALDAVFAAASQDEVAGFRGGVADYSLTISNLIGDEIGIPMAKSLLGDDIGIPKGKTTGGKLGQ